MRGVLALLALAWLGWGIHGAFSYGDAYLKYRGFPPPKDPAGVPSGSLHAEQFWSPALHMRRTYLVYTPPGYSGLAARGARLPVLYLLHGSPGRPTGFLDVARAGVALDVGLHRHALRPFILVMPDGSDGHFRNQTEWADTPHGRYESYVLDVVRDVQHRFAVARGRRYRAIAGYSEGGFGSINIALHHLRVFSIAESWSGYFTEHASGPFAGFPASIVRGNSPAAYVPALRGQLHRDPLHAYVYKASHEPTLAQARGFARELAAAGGRVTFRTFRGHHDWKLWRDETPRMLAYASHWFGRTR